MKVLGLRLNAKKSVLSPLQRTTYLGVVWDSTTMQARLSPARIESILAAVRRVREGQSLTVKQFQRLLGLMAAASNVMPIGLLYMRPLQWWLKTKGFSPRGNPLRMIKVTRHCLRALDMWRQPWFLSQGPVLGAPYRRVRERRTHPSPVGQTPCRDRGLCPGGMDASHRGGEADMGPGSGGPLRYSGDSAMSPLVLSTSSSPLGLDAMVQTWPRLRLYAFPRLLCSLEFWRECAGTEFGCY